MPIQRHSWTNSSRNGSRVQRSVRNSCSSFTNFCNTGSQHGVVYMLYELIYTVPCANVGLFVSVRYFVLGGQTEARVKGVAVAGKYVAPGRREDGGDRRGESMSMRRG